MLCWRGAFPASRIRLVLLAIAGDTNPEKTTTGWFYTSRSIDRLIYNQGAHTWIQIQLVPAELVKFWSMHGMPLYYNTFVYIFILVVLARHLHTDHHPRECLHMMPSLNAREKGKLWLLKPDTVFLTQPRGLHKDKKKTKKTDRSSWRPCTNHVEMRVSGPVRLWKSRGKA